MSNGADFYDRGLNQQLDGSSMFYAPEDARAEAEVAAAVGVAFRCEVWAFGPLAPIDFYAERHGRMVGLLEVKCRSHATTRHATVYLSIRKWLALQLATIGTGVPGLFVVRFTDGIRWARVADVDARALELAGASRGPSTARSRATTEPVIHVPLELMQELPS